MRAGLSRLPLEDTDIRTAQGGDVLGRATVRRLEVADSVRLVEADLQHLARLGEEEKLREGESDTALWRAPMPDTLPGGMLAVAQVEGWRGELCHVAVTDAEGRFSLQTVACLGCCSLAPVMAINGRVYGKLDRKNLVKILNEYRKMD